jgi:hypothetical protein
MFNALMAETKSDVFKITAMLKTVVWEHLTNMQKDVTDLKSSMETGFAQITTKFKNVCSTPLPTPTRHMMHASLCYLSYAHAHTHTCQAQRHIPMDSRTRTDIDTYMRVPHRMILAYYCKLYIHNTCVQPCTQTH